MSETTPHQKKRRNARSHKAILDATVKLLGSNGYIDFSIEKVAGEAGVGKQTIYRWWDSRADLVLEVWRDRLLPPLPVYDEKTPLRDYLEASLLAFGKTISRTDCRQAAIYSRMAEAVYLPRIALIRMAFREAQEQGLFPAEADIDVAIDQLYGAVWYKVLIRFETVNAAYIKKLVNEALAPLS
jgi:AcrR family transcriptional regulator